MNLMVYQSMGIILLIFLLKILAWIKIPKIKKLVRGRKKEINEK